MLDDSKHMLAPHRDNWLSWDMCVVPGEDPTCNDKLPLAGLLLEATDLPQVFQIRGEQRRMWTRFHGLSRKPFGRDSSCKPDHRPGVDTRCLCRIVIDKPADQRLIN